MKNLFKSALAMLMALALFLGCALGEAAEQVVEEAVADESSDPVLLVTVNGEEIFSDNPDMVDLISYYSEYYGNSGLDTSDESIQTMFKAIGLDWAIECALYRQKEAEYGVSEISEEKKAELEATAKSQWDEIITYYASMLSPVEDDATEEEQAASRASALSYIETYYGYTEDSYVDEYVTGMSSSILRENVFNAIYGEVELSEDEILNHFHELVEADRETYEGNVFMYEYYTQYMGENSYYVPEGYRGITHILLEVDDDLLKNYTDLTARLEEQQQAEEASDDVDEEADEDLEATDEAAEEADEAEEAASPEPTAEPVTQEMVDAARQAILDSVKPTVDEIMDKFNAGTPFADLIAEYGTDPGMQSASNLESGYLVHKDSILWDPAFTEGAMGLEKVGDISEPVIGTYGVHILFYLRDVPAGAVDMTAEIRDTIKEELLSDKKNDLSSEMVSKWKAEADIQYTEAGQAILDAAAALSEEDEGEEADEDLSALDEDDAADDEVLSDLEIENAADDQGIEESADETESEESEGEGT